MKVLLINPVGGQEKAFPLGLACLAAALREEGHQVAGCDLSFDGDGLWRLMNELVPDTVGISVNCATATEVAGIVTNLRSLSVRAGARPAFVLGGPALGTGEADWLADIDRGDGDLYVVAGDGERALAELMAHLGNRRQPLPVNAARLDNTWALPVPRSHPDVDCLIPDYGLFPLARYSRRGTLSLRYPYAPLITSRGCVHDCRFCAAPRLGGRTWRPMSPLAVASLIERTGRLFGIRGFHIEDDDFVHDPDRVAELSLRLRALPTPVVLECMNGTRPDELTPRVIQDLALGGVRTVTIGVETTVPELARALGRTSDRQLVRQVVREIRRAGMTAGGYYMLGLPGETRDMALETVRDALSSGCDLVKFSLFCPVPGSAWESRPRAASPTTARLRRQAYFRAYLRPRALRALYGRLSVRLARLALTRIADALGGERS